jgi:ornithine cyclodeaminase/mu-crystallin family protein
MAARKLWLLRVPEIRLEVAALQVPVVDRILFEHLFVLGLGEGRFAPSHVVAELGEVVSGGVPGRTSASEITVFKSLGLAVEDLAAASLAYQRASQQGKGIRIDLGG